MLLGLMLKKIPTFTRLRMRTVLASVLLKPVYLHIGILSNSTLLIKTMFFFGHFSIFGIVMLMVNHY